MRSLETFEKNFQLVLPNKQVVHTKPPTYRAVLDMYTSSDDNSEVDELQNLKDLITIIDAVDDVMDPAFILEWILFEFYFFCHFNKS